MKVTALKLARIRRVVTLSINRYRENHAAFDGVAAFYCICGAAIVLRCLGSSGKKLAAELLRMQMRWALEALQRSCEIAKIREHATKTSQPGQLQTRRE